ncbi:hypothetical protein [Bradyrhizobium murdochi]|uniref:hypothetical protein n=1 Tax=Bradyrhizobium murdochi TaxID=1038859 RepID=UPI0003FCE90B|nr:hypothetical protein [Bradyrhizobium murdochi]
MTSRTAVEQARAALAAIETELAVLEVAKSEAARDQTLFNEWRTKYAAATSERERLVALIEVLEAEAATAEVKAAEDALRRRHADRKVANEKLAQRIRTDIKRANSILLALVRDVADAAAEDARINESLPDDMEPLIPADFIARGCRGLERQELKTTRTWLWVNARGGGLIGDQDSVVDRGNGFGQIGEGPYTVNCQRSLFVQTEYFPAEPAQRPEPLWQMRLPRPDGPGWAFDGARCNYPAAVLDELARGARVGEPRERSVEVELKPVPSIEKEAAA